MFHAVLKAEAGWQAVPVREVAFQQRDRRLFGGMLAGPPAASADAARDGEGRPFVVPVRQSDRRLFGRILADPDDGRSPLDAADGGALVAFAFGPCDRDFFQAVVRRDLGARAARRGAWSLGATAFQTAMIGLLAFVTAHLAAFAAPEPEVLVQIVAPRAVRAAQRGPPPPPPAAPPGARRAGPLKARPAGYKPPAPTALLQPREVQPEMKAPAPGEPSEDLAYGFVGEEEGGVVGGVVGGVPGGVVGGVLGGVVGGAGRGGDEIEEAPQYATAGFKRPAEADPGCVRRSVRLPAELTGYVSGPLTVKFGVGREGTVGAVEILGGAVDPRVAEAIRRAVRGCRWVPGSDARGQPVAIWVILPVRFQSE